MGADLVIEKNSKINATELESMSEIETRIMGGSLSVTFGPGLKISAVSNSANSPIITIHNLSPSTHTEDVISLLSPFKEDINRDAIRIVETAETVYATINLDDSTTANTVIKALDGLEYKDNMLSVRSLQTTAAQDATRISCSWFAPTMMAYAHFDNYVDAQVAAAKGKKMIHGRLVECKLQIPTTVHTRSFSVWLGGLDIGTTTEDIKRVLRCGRVTIEKPSYSLSEGEAAVYIRSLFDQKKQIKEFDIVSEPNASKTRAIVQFKTAEDARASFKMLSGKKQTFLGNSPLDLSLIFSAKFKVLAGIYRAVANELNQISQKGKKEGFVKVKIFGAEGYSLVTIRVYGPERGTVASTKAAIQKVVRGEIGCDEGGGILWDPFLNTTEGVTLIKGITSSTGAYIYCDPRKRQISLYGSPAARAEAMTKLIAEVKRINNQSQEIPLGALSFRNAMRGGLKAIEDQFGSHRISVDIAKRSLLFRGTTAEASLVKQSLLGVEKVPKKNEVLGSGGEECLICFSEPEDPRTAPCGHLYCQTCLQGYLISSIETRKFPLKCVGNQNTPICTTEFPIPFIGKALPKTDMDDLFAAVFNDYIQLHIKDFQYCPTPDCSNVYSTTTTGEMVTCSECFVGICTTCNVEAHDGQTCAEYKGLDPVEGDKLFQEWKEKAGVKACPTCGTSIEKNGGCNHMECRNCKSHICWVCMGVFKSIEIYKHMEEKHGGIGGAGIGRGGIDDDDYDLGW